MASIKMKIHGMYDGISFQKGDIVELSEEDLKGLDPKDYECLEGDIKGSESEEKMTEKSSDKMLRPRSKK